MKLPLLICALLFIIAGSVYGQLGQGEDATAAKFGKPFGNPRNVGGFKVINYRTDAYDITAGFKDGKAVWFLYKKHMNPEWTDANVKDATSAHGETWGRKAVQSADTGLSNHGKPGVQWRCINHQSYCAEVHPEQQVLVIWDSSGGLTSSAILDQNML